MATTTTPNMNLELPTTTTVGPEYVAYNTDAFEAVDAHDHTAGKGVKITPAGLNINADLSLASNDLIDINSLVMDSLGSDPATGSTIFVKNGELFYLDDSANSVQITNNGSVAGSTGTIGGMGGTDATATYSDFNQDFTFLYDAAKPARMVNADILLYPFDGTTVFSDFVTLRSSTLIATQYDWTFPLAVPSKTSPLVWSGAGVVDDIELNDGQFLIGSTAGAVAAGTITGTTNQITVTPSANGITLAAPQDLATTSSPTFATALVGSGSVGTPALRFSTDTNTGIYRIGTDDLGISAAGALVASFDTAGVQVTGSITATGAITSDTDIAADDDITAGDSFFASLGAVGSPAYSFTGDTNTGLYSPAADTVNIAVGGTNAFTIDADELTVVPQILGSNGSASLPQYSFAGDPNTGMYSFSENTVGFAAGGAARALVTTSGLQLPSGSVLTIVGANAIEYRGSVSGAALGAYVTKIQVEVDGNVYYIPVYT